MIATKFKNAKQVIGDFNRFGNRIGEYEVKEMNKLLPESFYKIEKKLFESEGGTGAHGKWQGLTRKYKRYKDRVRPNKTIMKFDDRLYESLTSYTEDSIKFIGKVGNKVRIKLGSQLDYGEYHQEGIKTKRGVKTRRTIDPTKKDLVEWMRIIHYIIFQYTKKSKLFDNKRLKIQQGKFKGNIDG